MSYIIFFSWFPKHLLSWLSRWIECTILRHHSLAIVNKSRESHDYWWFQVLGHSMGFKLTSAVGEGCFLKMRKEHCVKNYKWEKKNLLSWKLSGHWTLGSSFIELCFTDFPFSFSNGILPPVTTQTIVSTASFIST